MTLPRVRGRRGGGIRGVPTPATRPLPGALSSAATFALGFVGASVLIRGVPSHLTGEPAPATVTPRASASASASASADVAAYGGGGRTKLRLDWSDLPPLSDLARRIEASQTRCSGEGRAAAGPSGGGGDVGRLPLRYKEHVHFPGGVGQNLHTWAQSLCHAVESDMVLLTRGEWRWAAAADGGGGCPGAPPSSAAGGGGQRNPMLCYFGPHVDGGAPGGCLPGAGGDVEFAARSTAVPECGTCPGIVRPGGYSVGDWMAASMEFLFRSVSTAVIEEAERQVREAFPWGFPHPDDLVTVNIRWGDKRAEMPLQPIGRYVRAVQDLIGTRPRERSDRPVHVYVSTEDPDALRKFAAKAPEGWLIHASGPIQAGGGPRSMWEFSSGRNGLGSLGALLVSLEANRYVLTTGSNWSRLINELRKNVVDQRCGGCTRVADLLPGEWPTMLPNGNITWESTIGHG